MSRRIVTVRVRRTVPVNFNVIDVAVHENDIVLLIASLIAGVDRTWPFRMPAERLVNAPFADHDHLGRVFDGGDLFSGNAQCL